MPIAACYVPGEVTVCHAALKSRTCSPSFSTLSAFSLQSHCTQITDICSQIANEVSEKVRPWFECKTSNCAFPAPAVSRLNPREQLPENRFHVAFGPLNSVRD